MTAIAWMRPVLVGEKNPYSGDPEDALSPVFPGSTGRRLFRLIQDSCLMTDRDYLQAFDRRNLFDEGITPRKFVLSTTVGSTIILLGDRVQSGLLPYLRIDKRLIHPQVSMGRIWRQVPHPSGVNRFYNDPVARKLVSMLLAQIYMESYPWATRSN